MSKLNKSIQHTSIKNLPETRKNGICEQLSTKNVAGPNAGVKRLRQKNTAWATPWPKPPAAQWIKQQHLTH